MSLFLILILITLLQLPFAEIYDRKASKSVPLYIHIKNKLKARKTKKTKTKQEETINQKKTEIKECIDGERAFLLTDKSGTKQLINDYCHIILPHYTNIITVTEKNEESRERVFVYSEGKDLDYIWNTICSSFNRCTNYDVLKLKFEKTFNAEIKEKIIVKNGRTANDNKKYTNKLTDINNCSEEELRSLPGISIIYAKKIIKRREEIGGFKDIREFFQYTQLSNKIQRRIIAKIIAGKYEKQKTEKYNERNIDL